MPIKTMPIKMIVLSLVVLIAIAGAVAAVPLGGGSGHDAGSGNQDSGNGDSGISSAELEDLQTVANQFGISLQEATDRYAWNDNFALAVAQIREAFPEAFAGAEIVDGNRAWVAFAGQTPEAARAMIDTFGSTQSGISVDASRRSAAPKVAFRSKREPTWDSPRWNSKGRSKQPTSQSWKRLTCLTPPHCSTTRQVRLRRMWSWITRHQTPFSTVSRT